MEFTVVLYESGTGSRTVEAELDDTRQTQPRLHALLVAGLVKLRSRARHRPPLSVPVGGGLFELRVGHRDIARALYTFLPSSKILVLRVWVKKTQKIPQRELRLARTRLEDHQMRHLDEPEGQL